MSVKSNYFKMSRDEFNEYYKTLKSSPNTINILDGKFFYVPTIDCNKIILELEKKSIELDNLINSISNFSKKQIVQSFLIKEIKATNEIENINFTKHDIFSAINKVSTTNKKIISISNSYKTLFEHHVININSNQDIRKLYDITLKDSINKEDLPDGKYYRTNPVYITNGIKIIHNGVTGENNINKYMDEFIKIYNSNIDIYTKMIICHFIFEYVHPFYDGNGRLGRFLFSNGLIQNTNYYFSFNVSIALLNDKKRYNKAFTDACDKYSFGSLNEFVNDICSILINYINILIKEINEKIKLLNHNPAIKLTKLESRIYTFIYEGTLFSDYGVSNDEIMSELNVSKRTLMYSLNTFKKYNIIEDTKIGRFTYHKVALNILS